MVRHAPFKLTVVRPPMLVINEEGAGAAKEHPANSRNNKERLMRQTSKTPILVTQTKAVKPKARPGWNIDSLYLRDTLCPSW